MDKPTAPPSKPSSNDRRRGDASNAHAGPALGEPPHNVDAEQAVLGACMLNHQAVEKVRGTLDAGDFYRPAHETIWRAILALRAEDAPTDPIALTDHLRGSGDLSRIGGASYLHTLVATAPPSADNADHYAQIVRRDAQLRTLHATGIRTVQHALTPGADPDEIRTAVETEIRAERERALASGSSRLSRYIVNGWDFVTKTGADKEPLWGTREQTAWASGESLMIVGAPGVGKTTIAHQVVLARLGLQAAVLDLPVAEGERVLYLAMDRPQQIARAMARRILPADEAHLRDRLAVWQGPLPATLDKEPDLLAELAAAHRADTIVIDSLKDAVSTLVDDSLAVAFNNARMRALRAGVQIMELHHQRKATADAPRGQRPTLDRVYGSTWLTAGAGSVLFIAGEAGDPAVTIHHLKTVTGEIGPLPVVHDHQRGTTYVEPTLDPVTLLRAATDGLTARDLATALTGEANPDRADIEKARRHLDRLVKSGLAVKTEGTAGGAGGGQQARYRPSARHIAAVS
ncbi:DnaB-like helicase N-terminal domain-containing protein [Kitasatospora sp. NPDC056531]|uniref:DnaB-like helicase N-terminal domain-containing protein n=1 Tax=Kitasatospora sp. NPDC056531 TaxID=3345856 RepID=UPI0036C12894